MKRDKLNRLEPPFIVKFFAICLAILIAALAIGQESDCDACHADPDITMERLTGEVSLMVTSDSLVGSAHEDFDCIDCHTDLDGVDFPHDRPRHVNCGECHEETMKTFMEGFFTKLHDMGYRGVPHCSDCHGTHSITDYADTRRVCGICHRAELNALEQSIHTADQLGPHDKLSCTSCHEPHFKSRRESMTTDKWRMTLVRECMECHRNESRNYVDSEHYRAIQSGDPDAPTCITCHGDHGILSPDNPAATASIERLDALCATCHKGYEESLHRKDDVDARLMTCVACHTGHHTQMVRTTSGVFRETLPATCNRCHGGERHKKELLAHGKIMTSTGNGDEANCTECHLYHWKRETEEGIRSNLRMQCQNCHAKENAEYMRSEHGIAYAKGHTEAPTCVTCHGDRDIQKVSDDMRPRHVIDLCSQCHGNREMALKFQINPEVVKSYEKTYHGQVYNLGYQGEEFATCINCHGNHDIRSQDDPESLISRQNIVKTCARCHEDANENFVQFLSHYDPHGGELGATDPERRVKAADVFMKRLLFAVFAFFGLHTLLWLIRGFAEGRPRRSPTKKRKWIQRFTPWQRTLHILLASSFLIQAMTGLPLKFSHSEIAYWITSNLIDLHMMALIHRAGAVMMISTFLLHLGSLFGAALFRRKRGLFHGPGSMVPSLQDARDMINQFKWFLWLGPRPRMGRWTYWEKFDYFAVFWGVIIIGSSGFVLWFPEYMTQLLPGWMINFAHIVHSEEALLATAFIFTVHFFNSHLRISKFPMDDVMLTGRESVDEMAIERGYELDELRKSGRLESEIVEPMKPLYKVLLKLWGWAAFLTGLTLLGFIIAGLFF